MLYGEGVLSKYNVIITGRQMELYESTPSASQHTIPTQLAEFRSIVRNSSMKEFNDWYELYKDAYVIPTRKRRLEPEDD